MVQYRTLKGKRSGRQLRVFFCFFFFFVCLFSFLFIVRYTGIFYSVELITSTMDVLGRLDYGRSAPE